MRDINLSDPIRNEFINLMFEKYGIEYKQRNIRDIIPSELQEMAENNKIGEILFICHGRDGVKINIDYNISWFIDPDYNQNADIKLQIEDIPVNLIPKFKFDEEQSSSLNSEKLCFSKFLLPVYCGIKPEIIFTFAKNVLATNGVLAMPVTTVTNIIKNYASSNNWQLLDNTTILNIGDRDTEIKYFKYIGA